MQRLKPRELQGAECLVIAKFREIQSKLADGGGRSTQVRRFLEVEEAGWSVLAAARGCSSFL